MRNEFDEDIDPENEDLGLLKFNELKDICEQHIENGNGPYDEDEFLKIVRWLEETRLNNILMNLVIDGKIDIIFNYEKLEKLNGDGKEGLLFTITNSAREEMEKLGIVPEETEVKNSFFDLKFNDDGEENV